MTIKNKKMTLMMAIAEIMIQDTFSSVADVVIVDVIVVIVVIVVVICFYFNILIC